MAISDLDYCERASLEPCARNLSYVRRVRQAAAFLRGRAMARIWAAQRSQAMTCSQDRSAEARALQQWEDVARFEARALADRRCGRDRISRQAVRQRLALRAAAPNRKPVAQADVDGLALFDQVRSPCLL